MWVRPRPRDDRVFGDGGVLTSLEGGSVVLGKNVKALMVESVGPDFGASGEVTVNGTNVRRLSVIVPGENLELLNSVSHGDDLFPSSTVEPVVTLVDPVLVPSVGSKVSEKVWRDGGHVLFPTKSRDVSIVGIGRDGVVSNGPSRVPVQFTIHPSIGRKGRNV